MIEDQPIEPLINNDFSTLVNDIDHILSQNKSNNEIEMEFNRKYYNQATVIGQFKVSLEDGLNDLDREDINKRIIDFQKNNNSINKPKNSQLYFAYIKAALSNYLLIALAIAEIILLILRLIIGKSIYEWIECIEITVYIIFIIFITGCFNYLKNKQFGYLEKEIKKNKVIVKRNSKLKEIDEAELIPGDIMFINQLNVINVTGLLVAGDIEYKSNNQRFESSTEKMMLIFPRSIISEGEGQMLVLSTKSYPNKINNQIEETEPENKCKLNKSITQLSQRLGEIGMIVSIIVGLIAIGKVIVSLFIYSTNSKFNLETVSFMINGFILFITLAIVLTPVNLAFVTSISFAFAIKRMLSDNCIINHISKLSTIAKMNYLVIDKSSVLDNNPQIKDAFIYGKKHDKFSSNNSNQIQDDILLNTSALIIKGENGKYAIGNPIESALVNFILESNQNNIMIDAQNIDLPHEQPVFRIPFNSTYNYMLSVYPSKNDNEKYIAYLKGSYASIISMCSKYYTFLGLREITDIDYTNIIQEYNINNYNIILFAQKEIDELELKDDFFTNFTISAVVGLSENIQKDIQLSINVCSKMGIKTIMLTEDKFNPSVDLCQKINLMKNGVSDNDFLSYFQKSIHINSVSVIENDDQEENSIALLGEQFNKLSERLHLLETEQDSLDNSYNDINIEKEGQIEETNVNVLKNQNILNIQSLLISNNVNELKSTLLKVKLIAEAKPKDSLLLLGILQQFNSKKNIIGVTNNDTFNEKIINKANVIFSNHFLYSSLKNNIGDVILLNNTFCSLLSSIIHARNIYDNIRKIIQFQLTISIVTVALLSMADFISLDLPLQPTHLLWITIIMDIIGVFMLANEKHSSSLVNYGPYTDELFNRTMFMNILAQSIYQTVALIIFLIYGNLILNVPSDRGVIHYKWTTDQGYQFTFIYNMFVFMQIFNLLQSRRIHHGEFNIISEIYTNKLFLIGIIFISCIQLLFINIDWIFYNRALSLYQQFISIGIAAGTVVIDIIVKALPIDKS